MQSFTAFEGGAPVQLEFLGEGLVTYLPEFENAARKAHLQTKRVREALQFRQASGLFHA